MASPRQLVVVADDFGIGPATSRGILELAALGRVTATVLMVNSPHAAGAVADWAKAGRPLALGWHPVLTCDAPLLPPERVPSLVDAAGRFWELNAFLKRVLLGRLRFAEIVAELEAQYQLFLDLAGAPPAVVNAHQHVALFPPAGAALLEVLLRRKERPFVRRIREPWQTLRRIPGARLKRTVLSVLGRRQARALERAGFPGCDWLAGITDPPFVADPRFVTRWLAAVPGAAVELACHPGYHDPTLVGRDSDGDDEWLQRRVDELALYRAAELPDAWHRAGFRLVPPTELSPAASPWAA